ncbi:MAG TPA: nucleoside phosphorylase [Chitinophagales bacterium]|jgi:uridine phosphorylase|nr:nucleoside phosphorylase [Chitinophagales bacterium]HPH87161.1 nucleoside phosphorylase [Chitinophagales bacterium]HPN18581.1 nucleoside phosphorylase [Chitinophagales bacterium]
MQIEASELILNPDGSIYHLNLLPEDIADTIFLVGDPDRVEEVSRYFDRIEIKKQKREFVTHTGFVGNKRLTCLSTGIGTDNIDIVLTELDALVNMDLKTRTAKTELTGLNLIRIGTCGSLQHDIPVDSFLASEYGVGLDGLLGFYNFEVSVEDKQFLQPIIPIVSNLGVHPVIVKGSDTLLNTVAKDIRKGVTLTNCGFYGPQGRTVRIAPKDKRYIDELSAITLPGNRKLTNMEMETSAIYGMSKLLGHNALSLNAILANRVDGTFSKDPHGATDKLIRFVLETI